MGNFFSKKSKKERATEPSNEPVLFPDFKPIERGSSRWLPCGPACPECTRKFDFFTFVHHCRACGRAFCGRCCYTRKALQNNKACGLCIGAAMSTLRQRELAQMETRIRKHSLLYHPELGAGPPSTAAGSSSVAEMETDHRPESQAPTGGSMEREMTEVHLHEPGSPGSPGTLVIASASGGEHTA
jgi:hypothetical protein